MKPPAERVRLAFLALEVSDLEASLAFYRDTLGVALEPAVGEVRDEPGWLGGTHAEISWREGAYLHFALFPSPAGALTSNAHLSFFVDDVELAHARAVAAGVAVVHGPRDEAWGRSATYRDPDGNVVGLTQRSP